MNDRLNLGPGLHRDIDEEDYHSDPCTTPSLSRSMATVMLKSSPYHLYGSSKRLGAIHVEDYASKEMDIGSVGHALALEKGRKFEIGAFDDFKTKAAREWRDAVREKKRIPILQYQLDQALEMKKQAIVSLEKFGYHETYAKGESEVVAIWEEDGGMMLRCMFDRICINETGVTIFDWKITKQCEKQFLIRQIYRQFYDLQDVWYRRAAEKLMPAFAGRVEFVFLFIEREWPYSLVPVELDGEFRMLGQLRFERAMEMWKAGILKNEWPGYASHVMRLAPPKFALALETDEETEE